MISKNENVLPRPDLNLRWDFVICQSQIQEEKPFGLNGNQSLLPKIWFPRVCIITLISCLRGENLPGNPSKKKVSVSTLKSHQKIKQHLDSYRRAFLLSNLPEWMIIWLLFKYWCKDFIVKTENLAEAHFQFLIQDFSQIGRSKASNHVWIQPPTYVMQSCPSAVSLRRQLICWELIKCRFYDLLMIRYPHMYDFMQSFYWKILMKM